MRTTWRGGKTMVCPHPVVTLLFSQSFARRMDGVLSANGDSGDPVTDALRGFQIWPRLSTEVPVRGFGVMLGRANESLRPIRLGKDVGRQTLTGTQDPLAKNTDGTVRRQSYDLCARGWPGYVIHHLRDAWAVRYPLVTPVTTESRTP